MPKTLIIAEKPSLAKNIVAAITPPPKWVTVDAKKHTGYFEGADYVVSSAFGHLLSLKDAEDYDPAFKTWRSTNLPIIPPKFEYKIQGDGGVRAQYSMLKKLIGRDDIAAIVNAGDSDREGEIIIRNILYHVGTKKPVYRLWMPDQTPRTIAAELAGMKADSEYDNLANEGYARTFIDWLYGINLTRMATVKSGKVLRVGRVTSPIVTAICEREREIRAFIPQKYYVPTHDKDGLKLVSKKKFDTSEECRELCDKYNAARTYVKDRKTVRKTMPRPRLFALSDLQGDAGKAFKYTPKKVLDILQQLYEAGYVSYPRTNSQYMATAEKQKAKDIIAAIHKTYAGHFGSVGFIDSKNIFDDSKIEAHSGLTPTYKIPNVNGLPEEQKNIYRMIFMRFCSVFCTEDYVVDRTTLTIDNGYEIFTLSGDVTVTKGYTVYEPPKKKQTELPPLQIGDEIEPHFAPEEKETTPPDHYTAETLNAYLKNPYSAKEKKELSDDEEAMDVISEVELGTEATRAGLIDAAIKSGYITLVKNKYGITDDGEFYVDSLADLGINMAKDRTLNLGKSLKQVYRSTKRVPEVVEEAKADLAAICAAAATHPDKRREYSGSGAKAAAARPKPEGDGSPFCKCRLCGGDVAEYANGWFCGGKDCRAALTKTDRYFAKVCGGITADTAKKLLETGECYFPALKSARTGREYAATVKVSFSGLYPDYKMEFDDKKTAGAPSGPKAGRKLPPVSPLGEGGKAGVLPSAGKNGTPVSPLGEGGKAGTGMPPFAGDAGTDVPPPGDDDAPPPPDDADAPM